MPLLDPQPKALIFDVFGTVVDWRTTVENGLYEAARKALDSTTASIPQNVRDTASTLDKAAWVKFAQEWRTGYMTFCRDLANDPDKQWKSVDQHHYDSLVEQLDRWELKGLWTDDEVLDLSLIWHRLGPWKDSADGLRSLHGKFKIATLSNGNATLLNDLVDHGKLAFDRVFSCEEFKTYKPNPKTYNGAVNGLGFTTDQCVMVAAHLFDLQAAKKCGLRTIYIARPREEEFDESTIEKVRRSGDIDLWIEEHEDGILTVAKHLDVLN